MNKGITIVNIPTAIPIKNLPINKDIDCPGMSITIAPKINITFAKIIHLRLP